MFSSGLDKELGHKYFKQTWKYLQLFSLDKCIRMSKCLIFRLFYLLYECIAFDLVVFKLSHLSKRWFDILSGLWGGALDYLGYLAVQIGRGGDGSMDRWQFVTPWWAVLVLQNILAPEVLRLKLVFYIYWRLFNQQFEFAYTLYCRALLKSRLFDLLLSYIKSSSVMCVINFKIYIGNSSLFNIHFTLWKELQYLIPTHNSCDN